MRSDIESLWRAINDNQSVMIKMSENIINLNECFRYLKERIDSLEPRINKLAGSKDDRQC